MQIGLVWTLKNQFRRNYLMMTFFAFLIVLGQVISQSKGVTIKTPSPQSGEGRGEVYSVVIGISDYQDPSIPDLRFADKDAEAFANFLRSPAGGPNGKGLDDRHMKVLTNQNATAGKIATALYWLVDECKEGDQVIIYYSGHGDVERKFVGQPGFLLCWDSPSNVYMAGGTIELGMLQSVISTLTLENKAKVLMISDACHAGKLAGSSINGTEVANTNLARQFGNETKILSCQPNEYSLEGVQWGGGRGAFSYHLVNALYGMANSDSDSSITLKEVSRYLDEHIPRETAPEKQNPVILGDKERILAKIIPELLASLRNSIHSELPSFTRVENRGLEDLVLAEVDTNTRLLYSLFIKALEKKSFFEPVNANADYYNERLINDSKIASLHNSLTRNFAAALMDDSQQAINIWLAADVLQLACLGQSLRLKPIPLQLERAASLLGRNHFMFHTLIARKLLFEGILLSNSNKNPNEELGRKCLELFLESIKLEPRSALPWKWMSAVYLFNLRSMDSAYICVKQAHELAPKWILPYTDFASNLISVGELNFANEVLLSAEAIDSIHPYVLMDRAMWLHKQKNKIDSERALAMFESYRNLGGKLYPCWFKYYGDLQRDLGNTQNAFDAYNQSIQMDSTLVGTWISLGNLYKKINNLHEAERSYLKAMSLDSTIVPVWSNLGSVYSNLNQFQKAESAYLKSISLDSTKAYNWEELGYVYSKMYRYSDVIRIYLKAIQLDSTKMSTWFNIGNAYLQVDNQKDAKYALNRALMLDTANVDIMNSLGLLYLESENYEASEALLLKANLIDSSNVYVLTNLGELYLKQNRMSESESMLFRVLTIDSTFPFAWLNLGKVYFKLNRYIEAEEAFERAILFFTDFDDAKLWLGTVFIHTGRIKQANNLFLKILETNPKDLKALLGKAHVLIAQRKPNAALNILELAIQYGISFIVLKNDDELKDLKNLPEWSTLMKKYFPQHYKE